MSRKLTTEEFQKRLDDIHGSQFVVLSEYVNNETKIDILCKRCGNVIQKRPSKMTGSQKEGCYICSGKNRYKTRATLQEEINKKYPDEFVIIGDYIDAKTPISVYRKKCGHAYSVSPDNVLRGKQCPRCGIRQSHYMDLVEKYFYDNGIMFEKEKRFVDCKNERTLPFDYFLPDFNMCIEVDGEFHYPRNCVSISIASSYTATKMRDQIKTEYCKKSGINLLRLPYYEERNFQYILDNALKIIR